MTKDQARALLALMADLYLVASASEPAAEATDKPGSQPNGRPTGDPAHQPDYQPSSWTS
jgi:hypothetical protein